MRFSSRVAASVLVLVTLGSLLAGCQGAPASVAAPSPSATPPARIISLAPSVTEILFALGAGGRMVGRTTHCNYPPAAASLPAVGDLALDYDRIVALRPDLVITESINRPEIVERLRHLSLRVETVRSGTLAEYRDTLRALGSLTGEDGAARRLVGQLDDVLKDMRARTAALPMDSRPRVFVEIGERPLWTAARGSFIDEMVTLVGGSNVFGDLGEPYPKLDPEAVVARDPEVVVLTASDVSAFRERPGFGAVNAVRSGRVYRIDADLLVRPSPRLVQGIRTLAGWVSPPRRAAARP